MDVANLSLSLFSLSQVMVSVRQACLLLGWPLLALNGDGRIVLPWYTIMMRVPPAGPCSNLLADLALKSYSMGTACNTSLDQRPVPGVTRR